MPSVKPILSPPVRATREIFAYADLVAQQDRGRRIAFLPAYGRNGAALLRIYNLASELREFGWTPTVVSWRLTLAQRQRVLKAINPDIVIMQGARHQLNRPALYPEFPVVYDMDDADFHLPHLKVPVARAMRNVVCVLAGSSYIAEWCRARGAEAHVVWTGNTISRQTAPPQRARPHIVAWAQSQPFNYVKEAEWVLRVMQEVVRKHPTARLRLYGRRVGERPELLEKFEQSGIPVEWLEEVSYKKYLRLFDDVSVGLAPLSAETPFARGKAFGKVLAYLDRRVPVVASNLGEFGFFFDQDTGIVSNDIRVWADGVCTLLANAGRRQEMADAAYSRYVDLLSTHRAASQTDRILRNSIAKISGSLPRTGKDMIV